MANSERVLVVPCERTQRRQGLRAVLFTVADGRYPGVVALARGYLARLGAGSYWTKAAT